MNVRKSARLLLALALAAATGAWGQAATTFPAKPIRFVVPFAPGGSTDTLARVLGQKLSDSLGQQVVIDNRTGANGNIGMEIVAKAPKPIVARLNAEFVKALKLPDVRERLSSLGFEISGSTPEHYAGYIKSEIKKWEKVVKASGAKPE